MRHTLAAFSLLLAPAVAVADDADAKALFGKMEATLLKAKSFQTEVRTTTVIVGKKADSDTTGRLLVAGKRVRIELELKNEREKSKVLVITDGKTTHASVTGRQPKTHDTDKQLSEWVLASTARATLELEVYLIGVLTRDEKPEPFKADEEFAVSDFKLGKKETVGGVETQAVDYALKYLEGEKPATVTVWIDTKTNLPVKRVITMKPLADLTITVTETYAKSVVDGKIDEKEFELPKK